MNQHDSKASIEKALTDILSLKFTIKAEDLIVALESYDWKIFSNFDPSDIFSVLEEMKGKAAPGKLLVHFVTVRFPVDENNKPIFSVNSLKSSACFPWEMDPVVIGNYLKICSLHHIVLQLAQASHYGDSRASSQFRSLVRMYSNLEKYHALWKDKNKNQKYQEYKFPLFFERRPIVDLEVDSHDFSEMKRGPFTHLIDKFYQVEVHGLIQAYEKAEKEEYDAAPDSESRYSDDTEEEESDDDY